MTSVFSPEHNIEHYEYQNPLQQFWLVFNSSIRCDKWIKMVNFKLGNEMWRWIDQQDKSMGQRKKSESLTEIKVCHIWSCSPWVVIAQWIERPPSVWKIMGLIPVGDWVFLFVPCSCHVDEFTFHKLSVVHNEMYWIRIKYVGHVPNECSLSNKNPLLNFQK